MLENNIFTVIDKEGKETTYKVISTFDSDDTQKSYIIYTENVSNNSDQTKIYASTYTLKNGFLDLEEIKSEEEWKVINIVINSIRNSLK